jgi:alpha-1,2-mannosyltransferase
MAIVVARGARLAALREARWLDRKRLCGCAALSIIAAAAALAWVLAGHGVRDPAGRPIGTDFVSFWTVSRALLGGRQHLVYDPAALAALERAALAGAVPFYAWQYPPPALLIVLPLALLPYLWALSAWLALGLVGYLSALWRIVPRPLTLWAGLAFPAVLIELLHGQNAFLTTALFAWGLLLLRTRPAAAGVLLGVLSFKPQLALLLPVALVAGGHWRALAAAAAGALALVGLTVLLWGGGIWADFLASLPFARLILETGLVPYYKLQSPFAAMRLAGGSVTAAYAVQAPVTVAAAAIVARTWRRPADPALQNALLLVATLLATPFLLDYDLLLLAPAIAWVAELEIRDGALPWERTALAAASATPLFARALAAATLLQPTPFVLAALLAALLARLRRDGNRARPAPGGAPAADGAGGEL